MEKRPVTALGRLTVEEFRAVEKVPLVLVLDNLRSALNVGSVFRTADAFAIERLVLCGITACPPHREINKTALGSTDSVAWTYNPDTIQALQELEAAGYQLWAVEQVHPSLPLQELTVERDMRYAFVLGNEVSGVSDAALRQCTGALEIPQFGTKHSLNVAVAAGIVVWEFIRRYRLGKL